MNGMQPRPYGECDKMKSIMRSTQAQTRHRKAGTANFFPSNYNHMSDYSYPVSQFEWIEAEPLKVKFKSVCCLFASMLQTKLICVFAIKIQPESIDPWVCRRGHVVGVLLNRQGCMNRRQGLFLNWPFISKLEGSQVALMTWPPMNMNIVQPRHAC